MRIFCDWRHKSSSFELILAYVAWPRAQLLDQSVSLKFSLKSRLEPESFQHLINFLAFLVQKLWSKINKLINHLISQIFLLTYITTFEPETPARHRQAKWAKGGLKVLHLWRHSQKNQQPRNQKFFSGANYKTCHIFWHFDQVRNPYRNGDIPVQSHMRSTWLYGKPLELTRVPKC